jgi:hypothetical protein
MTAIPIEFEGSSSYNVTGTTVTITVPKISNQTNNGTTGTIRAELWYTSTPYSGGTINGYVGATVPYTYVLGPSQFFNPYTTTVSFRRPPDGTYYATLTLEEYDNGGFVIMDYLNYNSVVTFGNGSTGGGGGSGEVIPVKFAGGSSYSFSGDTIQISVPAIVNSTSGITGSLRVQLWFTDSPYSTGTITGYVSTTIPYAGVLGPNTQFNPATFTEPFSAPPNGTYYSALTLEEFDGRVFVVVDHLNYSSVTTFGPVAPPPPPPPPPTPPPYRGPGFDANYYLANNPDVKAAGIDPWQHYDNYGWREGRNPDAYFSSAGYRNANPDVKNAGINPLTHYDQNGWREGRDPGPNFDTGFYLGHHPDVRNAGVDPLVHYLQNGIREGRLIEPMAGHVINANDFDMDFYLMTNPDVAAAGVDPWQHYDRNGWHEGRNPNAYFSTSGYLNANPDVRAAGIDPLVHYHQYGWKEGRNASALFNTSAYLAANRDVAGAQMDPLFHFLAYGINEGRLP